MLGFQSPANAESAMDGLKLECDTLLQNVPHKEERLCTSGAQPEPAASSQHTKNYRFWINRFICIYLFTN